MKFKITDKNQRNKNIAKVSRTTFPACDSVPHFQKKLQNNFCYQKVAETNRGGE